MKRAIQSGMCAIAALLLATTAQADVVKFTLGTSNSDKTPSTIAMKKWAEGMREASGGELDMQILSGGALGSDQALLEQLSTNEIQVNIAGPTVVHSLVKEYQCLEAEYTFRDAAHGLRVWTGALGREVSDALTERYNIRVVAVAHRGARDVTANKLIKAPEDFKDVKVRVTNKLRQKVFAAFGANPVPMSFTELYGGLQTGTVDAQENPLNAIIGQSFFEVQDYLIKTDHVWSYYVTTANNDFYQGLSEKHRKIFDEELARVMAETNAEVLASFERDEKFLQSKGMKIVTVDPAPFEKIAKPIVAEFAKEYCRPGILDDIAKY